ncbi:MAG: enoyl-CoA hydratase-related protein [Actinomycetota bacterium]|nr:enoyl-CoA hydratase-related protein [Actinomycetota bacterium]
MGDCVRLDVDGGIATIVLDRPKALNALNTAMQDDLRAVSAEIAGRKDVAAVVVQGEGRSFAAGADVLELEAMSYTDIVDRSVALQAAFTALASIPRPTVAAITGYALGGGCELALCCDFRVAGEGARLGQPEILLGIIPGAGGTQRLARLIGPARAKDLIFSGRQVTASEALAIGLVDEVVPDDDVHDAARRRVARYVGGPAYALRAAKEAVDRGLQVDLMTGLEIERALFTGLFATADRDLGMRSFREDGPGRATFSGR